MRQIGWSDCGFGGLLKPAFRVSCWRRGEETRPCNARMPMKNDPILTAIERLSIADAAGLRRGLESKSNLVAAKAAKLVGELLDHEFVLPLAAAFDRFLARGDKGCTALTAIARTLVTLECDDAELFRKGVRRVQMEGTWGGSEDVAAELRAVCAMGLANTRDPNRVRDLVTLLADKEWTARGGAARALAAVGSDAAAAVLRFKVLTGDKEPEVFCDCLRGLIAVEGSEALPLAKKFLASRDEAIRDAAIHALGESRRGDAIELLKMSWRGTVDPAMKESIRLAIAAARTEAGMAFIREIEAEK
jgi:HEAT repeat protein